MSPLYLTIRILLLPVWQFHLEVTGDTQTITQELLLFQSITLSLEQKVHVQPHMLMLKLVSHYIEFMGTTGKHGARLHQQQISTGADQKIGTHLTD